MVSSRRKFLKTAGIAAAIPLISGGLSGCEDPKEVIPRELPVLDGLKSDAEFWKKVRAYAVPHPALMNLNHGATGVAAIPVMRVFQEAWQAHNQLPGMSLITESHELIESSRNLLADFCKVDKDEIALLRNATEALSNVIFGIPLKNEDEVIISDHDYPHVVNAWEMRAKKEGIRIKVLELKLPATQEELLGQFISAIGPKTRVITVTQVINWNGQILPAQRIYEAANQRNIQVLVDGAHSFCHLPELNSAALPGHYFAASLHKWLGLPAGSGILHVKKDVIEGLEPRFAPFKWLPKTDIRKFEVTGTQPLAQLSALPAAIQFQKSLGFNRKWDRLQSIKNQIIEGVLNLPGYQLNLGASEDHASMITFEKTGTRPNKLNMALLEKGFFAAAINHPKVQGVRISPNVFTSDEEVKQLLEALREIS